jgi:hypothetical protein
MSYDLRVWGRRLESIASCFTAKDGWTTEAGRSVRDGGSWQIVVDAPQAVEPEDLPEGASELLPGLVSLTELTLEPLSAPKSAGSELMAIANEIAEELAGLVEDPQEGTLRLPRGTKRFVKPTREERITVLDLSWWYQNSPLRTADGLANLVSVLRKHVPEAVPRRYGLWEPPAHKTEKTGLGGLVAFLSENLDNSPILYPSRPAVEFSIDDCDGTPHRLFGFRANRLSIGLEAAVLEQPGWERAIRNLWRGVSSLLQPFYADARLLPDFVWMGATTASDMRTAVHPVRSGFWRGIPRSPGLAMALGPPYSALWKPTGAVHDGGLLFVEPADWSKRETLPLKVPRDLAQPWTPRWVGVGGGHVNWCYDFPRSFPFRATDQGPGAAALRFLRSWFQRVRP